MDFDDIQAAWNKDTSGEVNLPDKLDKIQTARTPLGKIRNNLKKELIIQLVAVGLIGFFPTQFHFSTQMTLLFYLLYSSFVGVCIYYLFKLYLFYRRLNNSSLNTKDSLYEIYYDIRLNMELYKTFGFALTPFMVAMFVGYTYSKVTTSSVSGISQWSTTVLIVLFATIAFSVLAMGLISEWWVHIYYSKYVKEIKALLDEIKEE